MEPDQDAADEAVSAALPLEVVERGVAAWLPSLLAIAVLATPIREMLLTSLKAGGRNLEGHALRLKDIVITGMCWPNSSYATKAVAAHARLDINPDLIGLVWAACVVLPLRAAQATYDSYAQYWLAARGFGYDMGAPAQLLAMSPSEIEARVTDLALDLASDHVSPEVLAAYWGLIRHPHIQGVLGGISDDEVVQGMLGVLPHELIAVINRV